MEYLWCDWYFDVNVNQKMPTSLLTSGHFLYKITTLIAYKKIILKRAIAERPAKIGAATGTHAYHHFESLLLSPRTALGKIACKRRGPRSLSLIHI